MYFILREASAEHTLHLQPEPGAQSATRIKLADCVSGRVVMVKAIVRLLIIFSTYFHDSVIAYSQ